jgi:hypothetical protein
MPNLNGTGPRGLGPMTGGGWGRCNPANLRRPLRRVPYHSARRILGSRRTRSLWGIGRGLIGRRRGRW